MTPDRIDPTDALSELGRVNLAQTDLDGVLAHVAGVAKRALPGAHEVSVTLVHDRGAHTAAFTGRLALLLDEWQYSRGEGPCLTAAREGDAVSVPDFADERRWPEWTRHALTTDARSSLSVGMPIQYQVNGALNVYGTMARAFDEEAVRVAHTFADYAAVTIANAHLYTTTANLAEHLRTAMESRAVIEQAKGIVMGERHCDADAAFAILTKVSQDSNRKLRDVAATLVARAQATGKR
jgi:GAF domain-containing protein